MSENTVRLSCNLHPEVAKLLAGIVDNRQCGVGEAVRQAIVIADFIQEQWRNGGTVVIERDGKQFQMHDLCPPFKPFDQSGDGA